MTEQTAQTARSNGAVAVWGDRADVRELDNRLAMMLPGADKLNPGQRLALAQASVAHGLDPFNGEVWMIPGRGLMIGVKGLRKKAREQVKGNFWIDFHELVDPEQRRRLRIPDGALAYEARLFDSENIRTFAETCERLLNSKIPWEAVERMVGSKPYTVGIGVLKSGESTKMEPAQCAMKRAEADAIKRRFDVPFGLSVSESDDASDAWVVEGETRDVLAPTTSHASEEDKTALYGQDEETKPAEQPSKPVPSPVTRAAMRVKKESANWRDAINAFARRHVNYQSAIKGKPTGEPNVYHILAAAAKVGFSEVTDDNWGPVLELIEQRAEENEAVPA